MHLQGQIVHSSLTTWSRRWRYFSSYDTVPYALSSTPVRTQTLVNRKLVRVYTRASQWSLSLTLWIKFRSLIVSSYKINCDITFPSTHRSPLFCPNISLFSSACYISFLPHLICVSIIIKGHYFIWELASLLHSGCLVWQPAAQHVSVILFSDSWGPLGLIPCIFVNIKFHSSKNGAGNIFLLLVGMRHM